MEISDYNQKFIVPYIGTNFKIFKVKDKYKLLAVNKKNGKSKTLFTGTQEECKQNKKWINEAYQQGRLFYYFRKD